VDYLSDVDSAFLLGVTKYLYKKLVKDEGDALVVGKEAQDFFRAELPELVLYPGMITSVPVPPKLNVVVDNSSFTAVGWESVKEKMLNRVWNGVYADAAVVRLTVSVEGCDAVKTANKIIQDFSQRGVLGCGYSVTALTVGQWGTNEITPDDALFYPSGSSFITMFFIVREI